MLGLAIAKPVSHLYSCAGTGRFATGLLAHLRSATGARWPTIMATAWRRTVGPTL
jgi:hypothetical protein